jgi:MFS family permease
MPENSVPLDMRANARHLYADIMWFGVQVGSILAFLTIFMTRQGASGFEVSLISAGPAVVNLLFSLPAGRWLEGKALIRTSFFASLYHRLGYWLIALLPWVFLERQQVWAAILITLVMAVPGTLLAISFNALFAEAIPPSDRAEVVGKRNAIVAVATLAATLLCGTILDKIIFPLNYQLVFLIGAIGGFASSYHISQLRLSSEPVLQLNLTRPKSLRSGKRLLVILSQIRLMRRPAMLTGERSRHRPDLIRSSFGLLMGTYLIFYTFQYCVIPVYPIFLVRVLNLTDGQIAFGNALFYTGMLLASMVVGRFNETVGHHATLYVGAMIFGVYPLLISQATGPLLYWIASVTGGIAWSVTSAGLVNRLMERTPPDERPAGMAYHNVALNLGILVGSLAAPLLVAAFNYRPMMLLSGGLRFLAGLLFIFFG